MRAAISITVVALISALLGTCSSPPSLLEQIQTIGSLRVVTRNSPTSFYLGQNEPLGPEYELAAGFARELGVQLDIRPQEQFWQILPEVYSGRAHVAAAGLSVTRPRQELVRFGPAYQQVDALLIYKLGTRRPRSIHDLAGKRLEVVAGTSHVGWLLRARAEFPGLTWVENPDIEVEELIARVAAGAIDYTISDSNEFAIVRHFYPDARAAFDVGEPTDIAWALPLGEDDSLRERVAAYFARVTATGELDRILDRYYSSYSRDFDYVGSRAFVRHIDSRLPEYRSLFQASAETISMDWRLLAAMAYQESHWDPLAVSPTGVRGIMMLTNRTASMVGVTDRVDAAQSIAGGAAYFARVIKKVPDRIPEPDRTWLAVAAYNVGFGHLEDARIITELQGGNPDRWLDVRERLPLLSQKKWYERVKRGYARGWEPVYYVDNVQRYFNILRWMTADDNLQASRQTPVELASLSEEVTQ